MMTHMSHVIMKRTDNFERSILYHRIKTFSEVLMDGSKKSRPHSNEIKNPMRGYY